MNTGRLWTVGWSDGLHQVVEAKEGVRIQRENHARDHHLPELFPHVRSFPA